MTATDAGMKSVAEMIRYHKHLKVSQFFNTTPPPHHPYHPTTPPPPTTIYLYT